MKQKKVCKHEYRLAGTKLVGSEKIALIICKNCFRTETFRFDFYV